MNDALAVFEIDAIAAGYAAIDAAEKRARVTFEGHGQVEPGKFLLLFSGPVAEVEEACAAVDDVGHVAESARLWIVDPRILPALRGARVEPVDAVGVVEGITVPSTIEACDRALKEAPVALVGLRIDRGVGGRAHFAVCGDHADVIAAVDAAERWLGHRGGRSRVVPRASGRLLDSLLSAPMFAMRGP
jgi:microcompartment protein CcmL/EutN